uniref:Prokineticin domain-containing protein n=1 Tax=Arion vulgaris TaxID=1028688 RepID=A0A0B7A5L1_9EUPU
MWKFAAVLCFICLAVETEAAIGSVCRRQYDCGYRECCFIQNDIYIASKRFIAQGFAPIDRTGTCQSLRRNGQTCNYYESCGCARGLTCTFLSDQVLSGGVATSSSSRIARPAGRSVCTYSNY